MRIVEIREQTASIASPIANAYIDFSKMTCSVVAVVTDQMRDGKRVVGYGFNSNGRYGQGALMRDRFLPRLEAAAPDSLIDATGDNLDPFKIWATLMANEKPGGHGERSVAVGTIDMAVWDAVAKIAGKPLYRLLAERFGNGVPDDKVIELHGNASYATCLECGLRYELEALRGPFIERGEIPMCGSRKKAQTPPGRSRHVAWRWQ